MEGHRGRSSSAGHQTNQRISQSPSPHTFHNQASPTDLSTSANFPQTFNTNISPTAESSVQYNLSNSYLNGSAQQQTFQHHVLPSNDFNDTGFGQSFQQNGLDSAFQQETSHINGHQANQPFQQEALSLNPNYEAYSQQQDFIGKQGQSFDFLDPQLDSNDQQQGHINPADLMSDMSSPQNMAPTPPNLMPPSRHSSGPTSPIANPGHQWSPSHSRNASASLDPSAAYNNGPQQDWQGMQFQTHRRAHSDAPSDVSSSAAPSPFLPQQDSFEDFQPSPSPLLNAQQDPQVFENGLGIEQFSISDARHQGASPMHSPFVSPRMSPQPGLGLAQDTSFMPLQSPNSNFNGAPGSQIYTSESYPSESFPPFQPEERLGSNDMGQATQMAPPEINVQLAPNPQQSSFDVPARPENNFNALSPPDNRGRKNGRIRAKSDTYISRPVTPSSTASTLGSNDSSIDRRRSLSPGYGPAFSPNISRESSPARGTPSRRSSTNSIPNRDYILELADPNRPPANGNEKRVQKHPATFQCTLCPKKFTRAYNLRSHLRTHTDERPFVCTVCGKAFARQHDRKRHEGLHSGEKKFVCRGELGTGGSWGCGRRFARADALGRHFRSEAGRVCIKPLLDEEAMERQRQYDEQVMNQSMQAGGMQPQPPMSNNMQNGGFALPAALLLQYPALQQLQWDQLGQGGDEEISGRSSFDASSGGEFYEEPDDGGYVSGPGTAYGTGNTWEADMNNREWASDYEGR